MYIVDSMDRERFPEVLRPSPSLPPDPFPPNPYLTPTMTSSRPPQAGLALHKLLQTLAASTPVLVLGNYHHG